MAPLPNSPFCIVDETQLCERINTLDQLADEGARSPAVIAAATTVYNHALTLCAALRTTAAKDSKLADTLRRQNGCTRILALEAFRYAQSVPYVGNTNGHDCYQSAAWTLAHGGECKALSVLFVAICRALGLTADPIWVMQEGAPLNHVFARVLLDGVWLDADASVKGAMLGETPYEAVDRTQSHNVMGLAPAGVPSGGHSGGHSGGGAWTGGRTGGWSGYGRFGSRFPFQWHGWNTYWSGWPSWWWCSYYPYLCDLNAGGFYQLYGLHAPVSFYPAARALAPAGCACNSVPAITSVPTAGSSQVQVLRDALAAYRLYNPFTMEQAA